MLTKERVWTILKMATPITLGLGSSFLMGFIDLIMVSSLGNSALAAIGLASVSSEFLFAMVTAASPAVAGIVARRRGEKSTEFKCKPLNNALLLVLAVGIPLTVIAYYLAPGYFSMISSDPEVTKQAVPYFRALVIAMVSFGIASVFKGFWTGMARPNVYLLIVLFVNCLNILLNYAFIYGNFGAPELGTLGAGVASAISVTAGILVYFVLTFLNYKSDGFLRSKPGAQLLRQIYQMAIPYALNGMLFSVSTIALYWMYGKIGTPELAASAVLVQVGWVMLIFSMGLGQASAVLVSNAIGEGDEILAMRWGWDAGKIGLVWSSLIAAPFVVFPEWFLSLFLTSQETISIAILPLQIQSITVGLIGLSILFSATLFSVGEGARVAIVTNVLRWFFCLPAVWILGPYLNYGLLEVWLAHTFFGLITTGLIVAIWNEGKWKKIKI